MSHLIKPIINAGGKQFYRVGPIYCNEVHGDMAIAYEVNDCEHWTCKNCRRSNPPANESCWNCGAQK